MAGTLKNLDCHPIKIGGVEEHVHVFCSLSKNIALSDLIGRLKVGGPFRAGRLISLHPGLKRLGYSVRPLRGPKEFPNCRAGVPARALTAKRRSTRQPLA